MLAFRNRLKMKWQTFSYNFGWSSFVEFLDGRVPRLSFAVPIVGYLVLFNDSVVRNLTFAELTSSHAALGLSAGARLKFLYLGLVLLGAANILYRWQRPYVLRLARDQFSYVETGLKNFTLATFIEFHGQIRNSGTDPYTQHGKYYDSVWDEFVHHATGEDDYGRSPKTAHWVEAKAKHENLLRSILIETFFREDTRTRRRWLTACLLIGAGGYVLLAVPSVDLFLKVMAAIGSSLAP